MRAALVLLLFLPIAAAEEDYGARIRELTPLLGSQDPSVRQYAARRLMALGEAAIPFMDKVRSADPEVTRALYALTRRVKTVRLHVVAPSGPLRIGTPVVLEAELVNNTDDALVVNIVRSGAGGGTGSGFSVRLGDAAPVRLRPDQVELRSEHDAQLVLEPREALRVAITMRGLDSPLRRPGKIPLELTFDGNMATAIVTGSNMLTALEPLSVVLKAPEVVLQSRGRTAQELDAAMRSRQKATVQAALAELLLRDDDDVLPVLRRHMANPFLRVRAVERIGAGAAETDLDLIRGLASGNDERMDVRLAAIAALGNYTSRKARSKLVALAQSSRVRDAAVHALTKHKHELTIDCFVRLLQRNYHEGDWSRDALSAILAWTEKHVENREGEIDAFERWWRENRQEWVRRNR